MKDRIYALFGQYVDQNVRDGIIKNGHMISRRKNLCVLFSDIYGFTDLCEKYADPKDRLEGKGLPVPAGGGMGCHFGELIVGDIGSSHRKNFTVIGDTVNIAARLESATRKMASPLLISSQVYTELDDATRERFSRIGRLELKGKRESIDAWFSPAGTCEAEEPFGFQLTICRISLKKG